MPELPEVETFCQFLLPRLKGKLIKDVQLYWPSLIKKPQKLIVFKQALLNQKFMDVKRRGKYLLFFLQDYVLVVHFRMEGRFFFSENKKIWPSSCLCVFTLSQNCFLYYVDYRRFGTFHLEDKKNYLKHSGLMKLGLEPFSKELKHQYLQKKWQKRTICIKVALLEQTVIAGIGNIYACEILFLSKISPFKKTNQLQKQELKVIIVNCQEIMRESIKMKGTTVHTFSVNNQKGLYFNKLKVYGRTNKPCFICCLPITKVQLNGRGTFYCSNCQKIIN